MRVVPRRSKNRRRDEETAPSPSPSVPPGAPESAEPAPGGSPSDPPPAQGANTPPAKSEIGAPADPAGTKTGGPPEAETGKPADSADAQAREDADATTRATEEFPTVTPRVPVPASPAETEAARRRARSAERRRAAAEVKRSRAGLRRNRPHRTPPTPARAAEQHRSAMLVMVLTLGLLIAAVAVTGALIASSMRTQPVTLAAPLHVYPVTQTSPGQCPAGTPGISGQSATGPTCYRMAQGIAIREVADLRVQRSRVQPGGYDVALTLRPSDRKAFADLTRATVGRDLAFVVRNRIITLPRVDMAILDGKVVVTGPPDRASANRLVRELKGR